MLYKKKYKNTKIQKQFLYKKRKKIVILNKENLRKKNFLLFTHKNINLSNSVIVYMKGYIKRMLTLKKKFNNVFNKNFNFYLFINKIFNSILKNGKKNISINYFLKILNIIMFKSKNFRKKSFRILVYFLQVALKLIPCFLYVNFKIRGKDFLIPWLKKNERQSRKKLIILGVSWLKKSFKNRKEKTVFLKLFSELEAIRTGTAESVNLKNFYYKNFYENKRYIKYLKRKVWI